MSGHWANFQRHLGSMGQRTRIPIAQNPQANAELEIQIILSIPSLPLLSHHIFSFPFLPPSLSSSFFFCFLSMSLSVSLCVSASLFLSLFLTRFYLCQASYMDKDDLELLILYIHLFGITAYTTIPGHLIFSDMVGSHLEP